VLKSRETFILAMGKRRKASLVRLSDMVCRGKSYCVAVMQDPGTFLADLSMH